MKKIIVLLTLLSTGFSSCKKDMALASNKTESLSVEGAAVIVAGNLSFSSKTNTGLAKVYRQKSGNYVLGLEQMDLNAGTSLVIYLSQSKTLSAPSIKVFSATSLYGNVLHILPSAIDFSLFKYLIIQAEPSEAVIATADLS